MEVWVCRACVHWCVCSTSGMHVILCAQECRDNKKNVSCGCSNYDSFLCLSSKETESAFTVTQSQQREEVGLEGRMGRQNMIRWILKWEAAIRFLFQTPVNIGFIGFTHDCGCSSTQARQVLSSVNHRDTIYIYIYNHRDNQALSLWLTLGL